MIAAWMVYAIVVSGTLALAAMAVERGLALYRRPVRLAWLAALLAGFWLPLLGLLGWPSVQGGRSALGSMVAATLPPLLVGPAGAYSKVEVWAGALDTALVGGWLVASGVVLLSLVATVRRLKREGSAWTREELDGVPVLVSPDLGPALFGLFAGSIVVPRWFRDLPVEARRLALLHEREHLRARDTGLLLMSLVTVALVPWNPVMWWMLRRLREAVELDCDDRVLASGTNRLAYASVLLDVSERSVPLGLAKPALAEPKALLSRRIAAMLPSQMKIRWPSAAVYGLTALTLLALACETPAPDRAGTGPTDVTAAVAGVVPENAPGLQPPERVSFPPPQYPAMLREAGIEGRVLTTFVVGTDGHVEPGSVQILQSSNGAFEAPVRYAIQKAVFLPGRLHGEAVRVQVRMPVRFVIPK
jgi:bla regulator protein BlaR1